MSTKAAIPIQAILSNACDTSVTVCAIYLRHQIKNNPHICGPGITWYTWVYSERLDKSGHLTYDWIRASASMPLASKVIELEGKKVLDGGVADSIPLEFFEHIGYDRNIVILTQPEGYVKEHNRLMPLMRIALRKYPNMIEALDKRHLMYNRQLEYVREAEREGRCLVIRPDAKLPIGHISHDPDEMMRVYNIGRSMGERELDEMRKFLKKNI